MAADILLSYRKSRYQICLKFKLTKPKLSMFGVVMSWYLQLQSMVCIVPSKR